jgi:hypothetical protein
LKASYTTSSEGQSIDLEVDGSALALTYLKNMPARCNTPQAMVAQEPCWGPRDLTTVKAHLTDAEQTTLANTIQSSGFFDLEDGYNTTGGDRYYAHTIDVTVGGTEKKVVYGSTAAPGAEPEPDAFNTVEQALLHLAKAKLKVSL